MAGLDPATQSSRVSAMKTQLHHEATKRAKFHKEAYLGAAGAIQHKQRATRQDHATS